MIIISTPPLPSQKVPGATQADLTTTAKQTQLYVCRVNDQFCNCVFSDWVKVKVLDIDKSGTHCDTLALIYGVVVCLILRVVGLNLCVTFHTSGLPLHWQGELHIAVNPKPQTVRHGAKLTLRCLAFGIPTPYYQWYRNGQPLQDMTGDTLQVREEVQVNSYLTSELIVIVYSVLYLLCHFTN